MPDIVPTRDPAVAALEQRLGVALVNPEVALAALTHKSYVNEHRGEALQDNERLEFLGDAVIDLAVSHRLMERFPDAREGDLSKIRAAVVDEAGLALMARQLDLGPLLRLGRGEELTGGRAKSSLLADAMEAVVAALFLGGGLEPVLAVIDRFLGDAFARAAAGTLDRDYKTQLQELAQSRLRSSPRYRVVAEHGPDHSKVFEVELELQGEVIGRGSGRSKKDAEQAAAKLALDAMTHSAPAAEPGTSAGSDAVAAPGGGGGGGGAVAPAAPAPEEAPPPQERPAGGEAPSPAPVSEEPAAPEAEAPPPQEAASTQPERPPAGRTPRKRKPRAEPVGRARPALKTASMGGRRAARRAPVRSRPRKPTKK